MRKTLLLALALRLLYLADVSGQPFFTAPIVDQASYDRWAAAIAASGDWLGQEPFYQDPLYPYFLAVIYKIFGRHLVLGDLGLRADQRIGVGVTGQGRQLLGDLDGAVACADCDDNDPAMNPAAAMNSTAASSGLRRPRPRMSRT